MQEQITLMKRTAGRENEWKKCLKLSCMSSSGQKIEKGTGALLQGVHLSPGVTSYCSWKLKKETYQMDSLPQIISNNCLLCGPILELHAGSPHFPAKPF